MPKRKQLAGFAHDVAHHAGSGLSYLAPHLPLALRSVGERTTEIELRTESPYPPRAAESVPLRLALESLKRWVEALLATHGYAPDEVTSIVLCATPAPWDGTGYVLHMRAIVASKHGRKYDSGWIA